MRITVEVKAGSNKEKLLRKHFGSPARIVKGMASTIKIVEIEE
jgi:hypothetical protein